MSVALGKFVDRLKSCSHDYNELRSMLNRLDITPSDLFTVKEDISFDEDTVTGIDVAIDHLLKVRTEEATAMCKKILESWKMPNGDRSGSGHFHSIPGDTTPVVYVREDLFQEVYPLFNDVVNDVRNSFDCPCHGGIGWKECTIQCTIDGINRSYGTKFNRWSDGMLK